MWLKKNMSRLINKGSVDDIRSYLRINEDSYTADQLRNEKLAEMKGQNRATVLRLIQAAIERKEPKITLKNIGRTTGKKWSSFIFFFVS